MDLSQNGVGADGAQALAESKHLRGLLVLRLADNPITPSAAAALAASPPGRRLALLEFEEAPPPPPRPEPPWRESNPVLPPDLPLPENPLPPVDGDDIPF